MSIDDNLVKQFDSRSAVSINPLTWSRICPQNATKVCDSDRPFSIAVKASFMFALTKASTDGIWLVACDPCQQM